MSKVKSQKPLKLGFSPCPNDTYIFDALVHKKVDTEGLDFEIVMEDVEALNRLAFAGEIEVTKLSYHAFAHLTDKYRLLSAGSALGNNCGPLLVARRAMDWEEVNRAKIVIPGRMTTANFLLSMAFPQAVDKTEIIFSEIEDAVLEGRADAGLLIHENRFTYEKRGLVKIADLGEWWERTTGFPIPLGGIVVRQDLPVALQRKINRVLRRSVEFAFAHPDSVMPFVRAHAQAMDEAVMRSHIELYVSEFTKNLGRRGRAAIRRMFKIAGSQKIIKNFDKNFFVN